MKYLRHKAERLYRMKNFAATLPYHLLVMSSVAAISFIFDKWLEAVCFLVAFFALRYKFSTTFHAKSIVVCMTLTNIIFAASIVLCPSIYMYAFGAMVFAYIDCLLLWEVQRLIECKQDNVTANLTIEQLTGQIAAYQNPKARLLEQCRTAKLSARDTEIAVKYYYEHQTPKEIWLWLCDSKIYEAIEWDSVYRLLWTIGRKLGIKK